MAQAPHPRMHGLTHLAGGSDPIPLLPTYPTGDTLDEKLLVIADAWWKLDETTGTVAHDSSGNGHDLDSTGYTPPIWAQPAGPPGTTTAQWVDNTTRLSSPGGSPLTSFTDNFTAGVWVNAAVADNGELIGQGTSYHLGSGWNIMIVNAGGGQKFAALVAGNPLYGNNLLTLGTWYFVAVVRDAGTWKLYVDGRLQTATITDSPGTGHGSNTWLGNDGYSSSHGSYLRGRLSYAFIVDRPMSGTELLDLLSAADTPPVTDHTGEVLAIDDTGQPAWQPPGVTVEHGDGTPDEAPVAGPGGTGSASTSGWHLSAHTETAVLYDSSPARFDVPSMQWVRTPFNTVRIQRTWETTVGGPTRSAWLPDDRGLTEQARNGLLHINADMVTATAKHIINGFFSIEYPVLDYQGLPDYTGGGIIAPDDYVRAGRVLNASTGVVLRRLPGSTQRRFMQWEFFNDADGIAVSVLYTVDNPYPIYPVWPARPLTLPQPYPKLPPDQSLNYYLTNFGNPGFNDGTFNMEQNLVAGDNLCLQAWQDSPWLLRFSTDHFPNWQPWPDVLVYLRRPFLSVSYTYDPETVDHTTGKVL